jgi:8-oxo-dGTP diphosphatase
MTLKREYPDQPVVGVGGVVIHGDRALLIRRGGPPLEGQWSIPGGVLELGETLEAGVARELAEETGLEVEVLELIEVFERIHPALPDSNPDHSNSSRPRYHFVIVDYLCAARNAEVHVGSDAKDFAWAGENELATFDLTPMAARVLRKAFAMSRARFMETSQEPT